MKNKTKNYAMDMEKQKQLLVGISRQKAAVSGAFLRAQRLKYRKRKMLKLVMAAGRKLKELKKMETTSMSKTMKNSITETKDSTNSQAGDLLQILANQNKNDDFSQCINKDKLLFFKDQGYVQHLCHKLFGEDGKEACMVKDSFSDKCCGFFVGSNFMGNLVSCTDICSKLIDGIVPDNIETVQNDLRKRYIQIPKINEQTKLQAKFKPNKLNKV